MRRALIFHRSETLDRLIQPLSRRRDVAARSWNVLVRDLHAPRRPPGEDNRVQRDPAERHAHQPRQVNVNAVYRHLERGRKMLADLREVPVARASVAALGEHFYVRADVVDRLETQLPWRDPVEAAR